MDSKTNVDKIIVNIADSPVLSELFSRMEVGDKAVFSGSATLDESAQNIVVLSLDEIRFKGDAAIPKLEGDDEDAEGEGSTAVSMFKARKKATTFGVDLPGPTLNGETDETRATV